MNCPTCGSIVPAGRADCDTCGASLPGRYTGMGALTGTGGDASKHLARPAHQCPKCGYLGQGVGYFSRGSRMAGLVGLTLITAGAMGAGGLVYYLVRRDHLICPRCGRSWGQHGERALVRQGSMEMIPTPPPSREGNKKRFSILFFILAAVFLMVGVGAMEVGAMAAGLLFAGGGYMLRLSAGQERDERREALIASMQLPVLKLAAQRRGRLTVTEVAAQLGWPMRRAEKILHSLDDGIRVDSVVTDEGVIEYQFRELLSGAPDVNGRRPHEGGTH